jgi:hypothetical protein
MESQERTEYRAEVAQLVKRWSKEPPQSESLGLLASSRRPVGTRFRLSSQLDGFVRDCRSRVLPGALLRRS